MIELTRVRYQQDGWSHYDTKHCNRYEEQAQAFEEFADNIADLLDIERYTVDRLNGKDASLDELISRYDFDDDESTID